MSGVFRRMRLFLRNLRLSHSSSESLSRPNSSLFLGIALLILGTICFAIQDGLTKKLLDSYSVWQVVFVRFVTIAVAVIAFEAWHRRAASLLRPSFPLLQFARSALMLIEIVAITFAFVYLELAEAITAFYIYPLIVLVIGATVLKEPVGIWTIGAVALGFVGLIVAFGPSWGSKPFGLTLALIGAVANAGLIITTRYASGKDSASTNLFYLAVLCAFFPVVFFGNSFVPIQDKDVLDFVIMCVIHGIAHVCIVLALTLARASSLQPYTYLQIVWSIIVGYLMFAEIPGGEVIAGFALIILGGVIAVVKARR